MKSTMNLDEIRERLSALEANARTEAHSNSCDDAAISRLNRESSNTALDDLKSYYRRFFILAFAFGIIQMISFHAIFPLKCRIALGVYFFVAGLMDLYLWEGLKSIDITRMGVAEVARRAIRNRKLHHIFQLILIPMAVGVLVLICLSFNYESVMLTGIICGSALGLACGLRIYFRIMRDYRELINE